ncbi:Protein zyg-11-like protein B [Armadillidium vulgare]|nr:Protein zyg-11-like protein B [Armadillidium vulgare]
MADSPDTLQDILIDYIASNLTEVCTVHYNEDGTTKLIFRDPNAFVHQKIANILLKTVDRKCELDDVVMTLFDPSVLRLSYVTIHNSSNLSCLVEIWGLTSICVNDLVSCFSDWTLNNIVSLSLHGSVFCTYASPCEEDEEVKAKLRVKNGLKKKSNIWSKTGNVLKPSQNSESDQAFASVSNFEHKVASIKLPAVYVGLCKLKSLKALNLSDTNITSPALLHICTDLQYLTSLDISNCNKIESVEFLKLRKSTLKSLNMYNLKVLMMDETEDALLELKELLFLDISKNKCRPDHPLARLVSSHSVVPRLLRNPNFVPKIESIDISCQEEVAADDLTAFITNHSKLSFLGLMSMLCYEKCVFQLPRGCIVTGIATSGQLLEGLKRYPRRKEYVPKILYEIFTLASDFYAPRPDIIKMILPVMNEHKQEPPIQLAGTACLYNLTKGVMGEGVHPHILKSVVHATLTAMNNFPYHPQLQKNALLTLCCDRILHDVSFDKFWCAKLVLDCLLSFNDQTTDRMAVAICSILAAKISTSQTALLGASNLYMLKLLRIVQKRMEDGIVDITLKFTLSALWNLTDESPATCEVFLAEKGLQLFLQLLETFPRDAAVETKVLGLLNNIAEVSRLRISLINKNFITQLRGLLRSEQVEVSYFAAGIVAHLVCAGYDCWRDSGVSRETLLTELGEVVMGWSQPKEEMVAYRSFQPFIPLLMALDKPQVQLWAVWALHHVTTKNSSRYCPMLIREGVDDVLRRLIEVPGADKHVCQFAESVVKLLPDASIQSK